MLALIDTGALVETVIAATIAGVGVSLVFSIVIWAATRSAELQRAGAWIRSSLLGLVALVGVGTCVAGIVFGIQVMATK